MSDELIHYGVIFSYYSAKTRAYLSYKRIPFVERHDGREMNRRIAPIIHKNMIPVVEMPDGEILQDTTEIIDLLEARYPGRPVMPEDPVLMFVSRMVEFIHDELWISTAMNSRWNDPVSNEFVVAEFSNRFGVGLPEEVARGIGQGAADRMQSYLVNLGVGDRAGQEAADGYFRAGARALDQCVGPVQYAFGPRPCLVDFCLYTGYFAHQYRDLGTLQTFMKRETPHLCHYLDNLTVAHAAPEEGDLELGDAFVEYLGTVGRAGAQFAVGVIEGAQRKLAHAASGDLFQELVGPITVDLLGRPLTRGGSSFSAWKAQRVLDQYLAVPEQDRARADEVAAAAGWQEFVALRPNHRLVRRDYQIYAE